MRASHIILFLFIFISYCEAQFFTKIANSIPRMGRRSDLPAIVRRVARTLRFVIETVENYDQDGNGELNPEELMDVPFIQSAVRNYLDTKELRGQYQPSISKGRIESEAGNKDERVFFDERLMMKK